MGHDHSKGRPLRAFAGKPGIWVNQHGWCRPLHVWRYRGAWRVTCWHCWPQHINSSNLLYDVLYDGGWPTLTAAFAAAVEHCAECPESRTVEAVTA